jgi:hypothetical protein
MCSLAFEKLKYICRAWLEALQETLSNLRLPDARRPKLVDSARPASSIDEY